MVSPPPFSRSTEAFQDERHQEFGRPYQQARSGEFRANEGAASTYAQKLDFGTSKSDYAYTE